MNDIKHGTLKRNNKPTQNSTVTFPDTLAPPTTSRAGASLSAAVLQSVSTLSGGPGSAAGASPATPAQGSSPGPGPAPPAPPPPDVDEPFIPPANVAVVTTAAELQRVNLAGALDIEIRSHLDLRNLSRVENPGLLPGEETARNIKSIALLYSSPQAPARSIRVRMRLSSRQSPTYSSLLLRPFTV